MESDYSKMLSVFNEHKMLTFSKVVDLSPVVNYSGKVVDTACILKWLITNRKLQFIKLNNSVCHTWSTELYCLSTPGALEILDNHKLAIKQLEEKLIEDLKECYGK